MTALLYRSYQQVECPIDSIERRKRPEKLFILSVPGPGIILALELGSPSIHD